MSQVVQDPVEAGREAPPVFGYVRTAVGPDAAARLAKEESFYRDLHDGYRNHFERLGEPLGTVGVAAADPYGFDGRVPGTRSKRPMHVWRLSDEERGVEAVRKRFAELAVGLGLVAFAIMVLPGLALVFANIALVLVATYLDNGAPGSQPLEGATTRRLNPKEVQAEHFAGQSGATAVDNTSAAGGRRVSSLDPGDFAAIPVVIGT